MAVKAISLDSPAHFGTKTTTCRIVTGIGCNLVPFRVAASRTDPSSEAQGWTKSALSASWLIGPLNSSIAITGDRPTTAATVTRIVAYTGIQVAVAGASFAATDADEIAAVSIPLANWVHPACIPPFGGNGPLTIPLFLTFFQRAGLS